jgi:hypothetical protein
MIAAQKAALLQMQKDAAQAGNKAGNINADTRTKEEKAAQAHWAFMLNGTILNEQQRVAATEAAQGILTNLSSLMMAKNKQLFELGKAFAIADTVINTYMAAQRAFASLAFFPPLAFAAAGAVTAAGLLRVESIRSQQLPRAEFGGIIPGSSSGTPLVAGEKGKSEAIIPLEGSGAEALRRNLGQGGGNTININVGTLLADETVPRKLALKIDQALRELNVAGGSQFAASMG